MPAVTADLTTPQNILRDTLALQPSLAPAAMESPSELLMWFSPIPSWEIAQRLRCIRLSKVATASQGVRGEVPGRPPPAAQRTPLFQIPFTAFQQGLQLATIAHRKAVATMIPPMQRQVLLAFTPPPVLLKAALKLSSHMTL